MYDYFQFHSIFSHVEAINFDQSACRHTSAGRQRQLLIVYPIYCTIPRISDRCTLPLSLFIFWQCEQALTTPYTDDMNCIRLSQIRIRPRKMAHELISFFARRQIPASTSKQSRGNWPSVSPWAEIAAGQKIRNKTIWICVESRFSRRPIFCKTGLEIRYCIYYC